MPQNPANSQGHARSQVVDVRRGVNDAGRPNSWAHVQFDSGEAVGRALQLDGGELLGRQLGVEASTQGE